MIADIHRLTGHGVRRICAVLGLPRSSYYHAARPTPTQCADEQLGRVIEETFRTHRRRYGYRRIRKDLDDRGLVCAPVRVRRLMRARGLRALQPGNYVPKTSDGRADKPSANLLLHQPLPEEPGRVWAGDITSIPTATGWLYLAVVIDLCSRRIVGWALAPHLRASLAVDALRQALGSCRPAKNAIFHSDRGSQYGSAAFRRLLRKAGLRQSMSARANPYHNAWTESFIGTLKREISHDGPFHHEADARTNLFSYIESYYNTRRKHSALGYLTPARFEANFLSLN
jgi:transposase InsO family protein